MMKNARLLPFLNNSSARKVQISQNYRNENLKSNTNQNIKIPTIHKIQPKPVIQQMIRSKSNIRNVAIKKNVQTISKASSAPKIRSLKTKEAKEWNETTIAVKKQADAGNVDAMFVFANILFNGRGVLTDRTGARKYFQRAAEAGHSQAILQYADILLNGWGMPKDPVTAVKYLRKAADDGNGDALCKLGACYRDGAGVKRDKEIAEKTFRSGAGIGHAGCQFELAMMLEFKGKEYKEEALSFYQKALAQDYPSANMNFLRLLNKKD